MTVNALVETELLAPVRTLFPAGYFWHFEQVPLGRKKIDLVCVERNTPNSSLSIELKIRDWRKALWQAAVNFQLAERSYIAIWHKFVHCAQRHDNLLRSYGVGLIAVYPTEAQILIESCDVVPRLSREAKRYWYRDLIDCG